MLSVLRTRVVRSILVLTPIALTILLVGARPVAAVSQPPSLPPATSGGITISPTLKELVLSSGLIEARTTIVLTNRTGRDLTAGIRVVDFSALNEYGGVSFGQAGLAVSKYALANWMALPGGNQVALPNGQSTLVALRVENRSDLAPGGHYGAVVVTAGTSATSNNVNFKQELVSLVFVKKLGGEQYGLQLQSLTADENSKIPNAATLRFSSTGNVHVVPRGYVTVTDLTGKIVAKGLINPESTLILPGTTRQFVTLLQPIANSKLPGRYTVTAYYRYEGQNQFSSKAIYIYAWRWPLTILILIVSAGVGGTLLLLKPHWLRPKKRYHHR
jgi:hypothetical protein